MAQELPSCPKGEDQIEFQSPIYGHGHGLALVVTDSWEVNK